MTWLQGIQVSHVNDIKTFTELKDLRKLSIYNSRRGKNEIIYGDILDLSGVENYKKLEVLELGFNKIKNLEPLANMFSLKEIYLNNNQISDLSPLKKLITLERLSFRKNNIYDASVLNPDIFDVIASLDHQTLTFIADKNGKLTNPLRGRDGKIPADIKTEGIFHWFQEPLQLTNCVLEDDGHTIRLKDKTKDGLLAWGFEYTDFFQGRMYVKHSSPLALKGGTSDKDAYAEGEIVKISASVPKGKKFVRWMVVSSDAKLDDPSSQNATFTMPTTGVEITAEYENLPSTEASGQLKSSYPATGDESNLPISLVLFAFSTLSLYSLRKRDFI